MTKPFIKKFILIICFSLFSTLVRAIPTSEELPPNVSYEIIPKEQSLGKIQKVIDHVFAETFEVLDGDDSIDSLHAFSWVTKFYFYKNFNYANPKIILAK